MAIEPGITCKRIDLRISFVTQKNGADVVRGEEVVSYDWNDDGLITYRAISRSFDPKITRDAVYTLDKDYRPRDAYTRIQVNGQYEGAGWFRFDDGAIHATTHNRIHGDRHSTTKIDGRVGAFCAHPVSTDVMFAAAFDRSRGTQKQALKNIFLSSPDPFGRTGPELAPAHSAMTYAGREVVKTSVGAFETDHYRLFSTEKAEEPIEYLWVLPGTCVFIQARAGGGFNTRYELVELSAV